MNNGYIEQFNYKYIAGWVKSKGTVTIVLEVNNQQRIEKAEANEYRTDLTDIAFMFSYQVPEEYIQNNKNILVSVFDIEGNSLANSPLTVVIDESERIKVLKGKENWLFMINDTNSSLCYLTGLKTLPQATYAQWEHLFYKRKKESENLDIDLIEMVIPEKEAVYSEYLPSEFTVAESRPFINLKNRLKYKNIIFPNYTEYKSMYKNNFLYSKGDTHWTYHGAFIAFKMLLNNLKSLGYNLKDIDLDDYKFNLTLQTSDLLVKTAQTNQELIWHTKSISTNINIISNNEQSNTGRKIKYKNSGLSNYKIMVWHTSSIDWMIPFLNDIFAEVYYIWGQRINWEEVVNYNPDIIFVQTNERFLTNVPSDIYKEKQ